MDPGPECLLPQGTAGFQVLDRGQEAYHSSYKVYFRIKGSFPGYRDPKTVRREDKVTIDDNAHTHNSSITNDKVIHRYIQIIVQTRHTTLALNTVLLVP